MRRKIFTTLALAISLFSMQSCLFNQEDIFDQSSSERLSAAKDEARKILMDAEYGWLLEMFPQSEQEHGGFAYTLKFGELEVEVQTERMSGNYTSLYKMTDDNGPALLFDTYNKAIHEFSTPSGSSDSYEAMHGEFEFVIVKATPELITLRGPRTGNIMYMRPLQEPAESYLAKIDEVASNFMMTSIEGKMGDTDVKAKIDTDNRHFTFNVDGKSNTVAYAITDTGLRFYEPVTVGSTVFETFDLTDGGKSLTISDGAANGTSFAAVFPEGYRMYADYAGNYMFKYSKGEFPVTLVPAGDGKTYRMQGVNENYEFVLTYSKGTGTLSLLTQILTLGGEYVKDGKNYIALMSWDSVKGYVNYSSKIGLVTKWNGDEAHPVYNLVDNGEWGTYSVCSFTCYSMSSTTLSSSYKVGNLTSTAYFAFTGAGKHQITNVVSLTKVD